MKFFILALFAALAHAKYIDNPKCNGVIVNGINHEKEILKQDLDKPYQLSIDYDTSVLYFSYTGTDDTYTVFEAGFVSLKLHAFRKIDGVQGAFATGVDPKTHKVYIGGSDGIYLLNKETDIAEKLHITNENVWQIFIRDDIYFTTYPTEEAFVYKDGVTKKVPEIGDSRAMVMALDDKHNIYYYNSTGLFVYKKETGKTSSLGVYIVNAFSTDVNGKLYFSTPTGIYRINDDSSIKKIVGITNIYGMAIDSDGSFIYAKDDSIIKLKSTSDECITELNIVNVN